MKLKLFLKYADGREYVEYRQPKTIVPEDVSLSCLRDSAQRAGNTVIESKWEWVEANG